MLPRTRGLGRSNGLIAPASYVHTSMPGNMREGGKVGVLDSCHAPRARREGGNKCAYRYHHLVGGQQNSPRMAPGQK